MPATCLGCGCACDDIQLHVDGNRIVEARNSCALGAQWFGDGSAPSRALVDGKDVPITHALDAATARLRGASRLLVFLAPDVSCEAQRAAIALADALHGVIDTLTTVTAAPSVLAAQEAGRASATLGEIKNRADVVVFWGVDPADRYPRFATRYAPGPTGIHIGGRSARTIVAVDVGSARGPEDADLRLALMPDREVATLTEFTAAIVGRGADSVGSARASVTTLAPRSDAAVLDTLVCAKYVAIVVDAEVDQANPSDRGRAAALIALAQALNGPTRCALISLRGGGNRSGADWCLTSQTGYPMAVDFSRGFPRYQPHDGAVARIARGAADVLLIIGSAGHLLSAIPDGVQRIPTIVIGPRASESIQAAGGIAIDTAVVGIHESGTALRMDDVPLPLDAAVAGPPRAVDLVLDLGSRLAGSRFAPAAVIGNSSLPRENSR